MPGVCAVVKRREHISLIERTGRLLAALRMMQLEKGECENRAGGMQDLVCNAPPSTHTVGSPDGVIRCQKSYY